MVEQNPPQDQRYSMDIRVFLAVITTAMAAAFCAGVAMGPAHPSLLDGMMMADPTLVHSVEMNVPSDKLGLGADGKDDHEPAGQHLLVDIKVSQFNKKGIVVTARLSRKR